MNEADAQWEETQKLLRQFDEERWHPSHEPGMPTVRHALHRLIGELDDRRFASMTRMQDRYFWLNGTMSAALTEHAIRFERCSGGSLFQVNCRGGLIVAGEDQAAAWLRETCGSARHEAVSIRFAALKMGVDLQRMVWLDLSSTLQEATAIVAEWEAGGSDVRQAHRLACVASQLLFWAVYYQDERCSLPLDRVVLGQPHSVFGRLHEALRRRLDYLRRR